MRGCALLFTEPADVKEQAMPDEKRSEPKPSQPESEPSDEEKSLPLPHELGDENAQPQ